MTKKLLRQIGQGLAAAGALAVLLWSGGTAVHLTRSIPVSLSALTPPVIILDPGHGGADGGAVGVDGIVEKDINLSIALKVRELLRLHGAQVLMTREDDRSIHDEGTRGLRLQKISDMNNRLALVKEHPEAIFVSIHQNQFSAPRYSGAQVFYGPQSPSSERLASISQRRFREMLQPDNRREQKRAGKELFLLYYAPTPAVMMECGFLSNPAEAHRLVDDSYQNQIAFVIFSSLMEYLSESIPTGL